MLVKEIDSVDREFMLPMMPHTQGDYTVDDLVNNVANGVWKAVGFFDEDLLVGAIVHAMSNNKCFILAIVGTNITTDDNWSQYLNILKSYGVTCVEAGMRDSALRLWKRLGFVKKYSIAEVTI